MTDKTEAQPEALRMAEFFESLTKSSHRWWDGVPVHEKAATVLRDQLTEIQQLKAQPSARQGAQLIIPRKEGTVDFVKEILAEAADELRKTTAPEDYEIEDRTCYAKDLDAIATMLSAAPPPPEREPLTDEQIAGLFIEMYGQEPAAITEFAEVCRRVEAAHGIGATND